MVSLVEHTWRVSLMKVSSACTAGSISSLLRIWGRSPRLTSNCLRKRSQSIFPVWMPSTSCSASELPKRRITGLWSDELSVTGCISAGHRWFSRMAMSRTSDLWFWGTGSTYRQRVRGLLPLVCFLCRLLVFFRSCWLSCCSIVETCC